MKFAFCQAKNENMASYRYRVKAPAEYLKSIGWTAVPWPEADVVVIGKVHTARDYALAKDLKRRGIPIAFDICDWHFEDRLSVHYKRMLDICDGIIVPTESWLTMGLRKGVQMVAGDGYEWDEKPPKCEVSSPLRILWYGHFSNIKHLEAVKAPENAKLEIITSPGPHQFKTYSKEALTEAYEWCDLVIVPAVSPLKSPNRTFEAIRQGRFVVASDLPQHRPCSTYVGDINEGIEWYRTHSQEALERLKLAQKAVAELYSPQAIGEQWRKALQTIGERARKTLAA